MNWRKKSSSCNKKIIKNSSTMEEMRYLCKNMEVVKDQMQKIHNLFKVMLDIRKEYSSLLPEDREREEGWFDEADHNM